MAYATAVQSFDTATASLKEVEDIKRCLTMLYGTKEGEQPLDRSFGLNWGFIDKPPLIARNEYALEVVRKTAIYETRVKVTEVTFEIGSDGNITPTIHLSKKA